ncbi:hypothetical protein [Psychroserpens mesophilus]|uniref:hypothetical protein n=1 Tax=Psychroserpens mesophilus TaxID=325473 RepID=UPI0005902AC3|nr:hypothetical protein [Psychroserpens mesophilus]
MKKITYLFILSVLLINCSGNDDSNNNNNQDPSDTFVRATIDGVSFNATGVSLFNTINAQLIENETIFGLIIVGQVADESLNFRSISIGIGGTDFNEVISGLEVQSPNNQFTVEGGYFFGDASSSRSSVSDEDEFIKITFIDKANQIISGEFRFLAIDDDDDSLMYNVTEGEFSNVSYTVID